MRTWRPTPFLRAGLAIAALAITVFHLQILWSRLADGSVFDPVVAGRWLATVALGLFVAGLRRRGISLLRGRGAFVLWLLVLLLHGVGLVPSASPAAPPGTVPAEVFLLATPVGLGVAALAWAGARAARRRGGRLAAQLTRRALRLEAVAGRQLALLAADGPRAPPR